MATIEHAYLSNCNPSVESTSPKPRRWVNRNHDDGLR